MNVLLEAVGVRKSYHVGRKSIGVLRDVRLSVCAGESVSIIGASGAGKSTLLHVLGALDAPDVGTVMVNGADVYALSGAKRARIRALTMGFVFQSYCLLPEMTVVENVLLPAWAAGGGTDMGAARKRARSLLEMVGLGERWDHMPMELSGGEQQRVALARALMNRPAIILADEPTGNLDGNTGGKVMGCLFDLVRMEGRSMVLVTHNEATAKLCDRRFRLADGALDSQDAAGGA